MPRVPSVWLALGIVVGVCALFVEELTALGRRWFDNYGETHGVLIGPLVLFLIWHRRDLLEVGRGPLWLAGPVLVVSIALLMFARASSVDLVVYGAIPLIAWAAVWVVLGWRCAKVLALPIGFFVFALPAWGYLAPLLQWVTVQAVSVMLAVIGLEAFIQGPFVTVPAGNFEVAGGCSGVNYMVTALAVATFLVLLERLPVRPALLLLGVAALIAGVANWLRVAIIIYAGNATDMQSSLVADHYTFGWWLFAAGMVPFIWVARVVTGRVPEAPIARSVRHLAPLGARLGVGAALVALVPAWSYAVAARDAGRVPTFAMPEVSGWAGPEWGRDVWRPELRGPTAERIASYRRGGDTIDAFAAFYGRQSRASKLVGYGAHLGGDPEQWRVRSTRRAAPLPDAEPVIEIVVSDGYSGSRLVWAWYEVRGKRVLSPAEVKLHEGLAAFGARPRSGLVAISIECQEDCSRAGELLAEAYAAGLRELSAGTALVENRAVAP
ncbi:MAG: EpsI family protein [Steroidobacteraceae bacterium]|nr:EpsI family protein [Steroidobacteraceae bacterium]